MLATGYLEPGAPRFCITISLSPGQYVWDSDKVFGVCTHFADDLRLETRTARWETVATLSISERKECVPSM